MNIVSVNVGLPRQVEWHGEVVTTAIFKTAVIGAVAVKAVNLGGDRQADLTVHGGERKAVYAYPSEHYDYWRSEVPGRELSYGAFGENLTTAGVVETEVGPGDLLEIGTAAFTVTVPRVPCYKLGLRFGRLDMVKRFWISRRCGFYLSVLREGDIAAGDRIRLTRLSIERPSIADLFTARSQAGSS
jgi:MOSC domain-containing protein YiiM